MSRVRISTTVDSDLLEQARRSTNGVNDARLIDAALSALVAEHRAAEIDTAYRAYETRSIDESDEWGDLESFRRAAGST